MMDMDERIAIEKLKHFISKDALNIDGLGKKLLKNLDLGYKKPQDIFINYNQLKN